MKRLFQILTQKWLISTIGLIAIAFLIWFGGPYLGIADSKPLSSPFNRLLAILVVIVIWGFNNLRHRFKATQANNEMIDNLVSAPDAPSEVKPDVSAEEVALLRKRFGKALEHLKHTSLKGRLFGKQYLYELPWYIIIGPPGSGKTTLLENSGLEFPLDEYKLEKKISGVGGTRNCDWWFTNDAVLLDTAGRYTTQDSNAEADSGAWQGFLELLRKQRPRRPLNGIIIAISAADILTNSPQERELHAHTIRQRIQELYSRLGIRIPIYFLLTKADLIAGFTEFFDDLGKEQRAQVWGITFLQHESQQQSRDIRQQQTQDALPQFSSEFDALLESLNKRQLWRIFQERDLRRRGLISGFPQQVAALKPLLEDFLQKVFAPNRYQDRAWLRGVYFSSGTQEGSPIDRVMSSLANSFGMSLQALPSYQGHSRSYFITRMFQDVLFKESDLASANRRYETQRLWLQRGAYAGTIGITLAIIFAWSASFTRNEIWVNKLENRVEHYNKVVDELRPRPQLDKLVSTLQAAKDISLVYGDTGGKTPWLMGMGLYQGYKLGDAAQDAYIRALQQFLLPNIKEHLEDGMRNIRDEPEELRRLLSNYVMLGDPENLDPKTFRPWVINNWEQRLEDEPTMQTQLTTYLDELLVSEFPPQNLDQRLMDRTQRVVCEIPLSRQIYARLQQQAEGYINEYNLARFGKQVNKILVNTKSSSSSSVVPGFYTYDGYHDVLNKEGERTTELTIAENRRICEHKRDELDKADPAPLLRDVRARYFEDYVDEWKTFLSGIKLNNISNLSGAVDTLNILADRKSPLEKFVREVTEQTVLDRAKIKGFLDRFELGKNLSQPSNPVEREFQPLHNLLVSEDDQPSVLKDLHDQLRELNDYVTEIAEASDQSEAAFEAAKARMTQNKKDAIRNLRRHARNLPIAVADIVDSAATQSWGTVLGSARVYVNAVWRSSVLRDYQASLENRYPIFQKGHQQISLVDFGRFFGDSGSIDNFINAYLAPFIDTRRWRLRTVDGRSLGLSSEAIAQIKRATRIKEMFFQNGGKLPSVRFSLKPAYLDANVERVRLELHGQQLSYQHDPPRTTQVEWPGPEDNNRVRVIFEVSGTRNFNIVYDGPWAWFRLLDSSKIERQRSAYALVTFSTAGLKTRYRVQASSVTNPFSKRELAKFRSPERL